jgi:hypothetical protein
VKRNKSIRKLTALALLALCLLSVTPRWFLHNLLAGHHHKSVVINSDDLAHVEEDEFNCDCDHWVAESPFIAGAIPQRIEQPLFFSAYHTSIIVSKPLYKQQVCSLRGPPASARLS